MGRTPSSDGTAAAAARRRRPRTLPSTRPRRSGGRERTPRGRSFKEQRTKPSLTPIDEWHYTSRHYWYLKPILFIYLFILQNNLYLMADDALANSESYCVSS